MADPTEAGCLICEQETADDANIVWRDDLFACEITPGFEVPGWVVVRVRRHTVGWPGLTDDELAVIGRRIADTVAASAEVSGAPKVYVMTFGEAFPHFHGLIAPRGEEVPPELRTARILDRRQTDIDIPASQAYLPALRAAYERRSSRPAVTAATAASQSR
jgi:diadenosine tetraphosphate (Ap4A) HIT family hydrolase